jgi:hypothetical protein
MRGHIDERSEMHIYFESCPVELIHTLSTLTRSLSGGYGEGTGKRDRGDLLVRLQGAGSLPEFVGRRVVVYWGRTKRRNAPDAVDDRRPTITFRLLADDEEPHSTYSRKLESMLVGFIIAAANEKKEG